MDARYASRKFILACAAFIAAALLLIFDQLTAQQWVDFNTWLVGLYLAGNVAHAAVVTGKKGAL